MRWCVTGSNGLLAGVLFVVTVMSVGCARTTPVSPQALEDAQLGVRVKTALVNDPQLGPRVIEVRVMQGVASLAGLVASEDEVTRALELTRAVPGIIDVQSRLVIGEPVTPRPQADAAAGRTTPVPWPGTTMTARTSAAADGIDSRGAGERRLLAVGLALGGRRPVDTNLSSRVVVSPMTRIGRARGLGPDVGFTWFDAEVSDVTGAGLGRLHVRPVMGGIGYTFTDQVHWALTFSLVGGIAFNSVDIEESGVRDGQVVDVDNSLAYRPGASLWYDVNRRLALNVFGGYVVTRPQTTFLERGAFTRRSIRADTAVFSVGLAWKLF